jgi:hypothetical protein
VLQAGYSRRIGAAGFLVRLFIDVKDRGDSEHRRDYDDDQNGIGDKFFPS